MQLLSLKIRVFLARWSLFTLGIVAAGTSTAILVLLTTGGRPLGPLNIASIISSSLFIVSGLGFSVGWALKFENRIW